MSPETCLRCDSPLEGYDSSLVGFPQDWCRKCVDNYEPEEPDGEAFRGNEAAEWHAEQMARMHDRSWL